MVNRAIFAVGVAVATMVSLLVFITPASAAPTTWYVDQAVVGGTGTSWADAFDHPQDALAVAASGDTVLIATGTYTPHPTDRSVSFVIPDGIDVVGGYQTGGTAGPDNQLYPTVLSGDLNGDDVGFTNNAENSYHVVRIDAAAVAGQLSHLTVTGGNANGVAPADVGGGVYFSNPVATFDFWAVTLTGNTAVTAGGGMYNSFSGGSYRIIQSTVSGNTSTDGGGVYGNAFFFNSLVYENAANNDGGGFWGAGTINGSTFAHNAAGGEGGARHIPSATFGTGTIYNSILWGNAAPTNPNIGGVQPSFVRYNVIEGGFTGPFAHSNLDVDPQFVDAANDDYRLSATSTVLGHANNANAANDQTDVDDDGDAGELLDDVDFNPRIDGASADPGAYETVICGAGSEFFVDHTNVGPADGLTWATAFSELYDALDRAAGCTNITDVRVATGTYTPDAADGRLATFTIPKAVTVTGGYATGGTAGPDNSAYPTLLSGDLLGDDDTGGSNAENSYHVVTISYTAPAATTGLADLTVTGGYADGVNPQNSAAGIDVDAPQFHLDRVTVTGNTALGFGGGLDARSTNGSVLSTITDSRFEDNTAATGGAISAFGVSGLQLLDIDDTVISANTAPNGQAVYIGAFSTVNVTNSTVEDTDGRGVQITGPSTMATLATSSISGNTALFSGGGLLVRSGATVTLINSLLDRNTATEDGGAVMAFGSGTTLAMNNTTISRSTSGLSGAAVFAFDTAATTTVNSIVWGNTPSTPAYAAASGGSNSISFSDVEGSGGSGGGWNAAYGTDGGNNIDVNPMFANPAGNLRLTAGSPALDVGDNASVPADTLDVDGDLDTAEPTPDLDLEDRIQNTTVDLGAYEGVTVVPLCDGLPVTVDIGAGDLPTAGDDVILGTAGDDTINALGGNDTVCAGDGDDTVIGAAGDDTIFGEKGDDVLSGNAGDDTLDGGGGADQMFGGSGRDALAGGFGRDTLGGGSDVDVIFGGPGNDAISGGSGNDGLISGGNGDDAVNGGGGNDGQVNGDAGDDTVSGNGGKDTVDGGFGNDEVRGGQANDLVFGGDGDDRLFGNTGFDVCTGGTTGETLGDTASSNCEVVTEVP